MKIGIFFIDIMNNHYKVYWKFGESFIQWTNNIDKSLKNTQFASHRRNKKIYIGNSVYSRKITDCLMMMVMISIRASNMWFSIQLQGYKVYYTTNPSQPEASWDSQMVDNSELTTISELTPLAIYTVRVQAFTSMGAGPMSNPVKVKTQQGPYTWISLYMRKWWLCEWSLSLANNHSTKPIWMTIN